MSASGKFAHAGSVAILVIIGPVVPAATAKPPDEPVEVVAVEVVRKKTRMPEAVDAIISRAAFEEQSWYHVGARPVVMQVTIEKLEVKSVGGIFTSLLPFSGENENRIEARIRVVDRTSGAEVGKFKSKATDVLDDGLSAGDLGKGLAKAALGFIPIPFLGDAIRMAGEMAVSAAVKRDLVVQAMGRNLMTRAFADLHGSKSAKAVVRLKKAEAKLAKAAGLPLPRIARGATLPAALAAATPTFPEPPMLSQSPGESVDRPASLAIPVAASPPMTALEAIDPAEPSEDLTPAGVGGATPETMASHLRGQRPLD